MSFSLSIRSKLALALLALTVLTVGVSVALSLHRLSLYVNDQAIGELLDDRQSIQLILRLRQKDARADSAALALKGSLQRAVVDRNTDEITRIAEQYMRDQGSDVIVITDSDGIVLAEIHDPERYSGSIADTSVVAWALDGLAVETLTRADGAPIVAVGGVPIYTDDLSPRLLGTVLVGEVLDDTFVESLEQSVGENISFIIDGRRQYTTLAAGRSEPVTVQDDTSAQSSVKIGGQNYHVVYGPIQGQNASQPVGVLEIAKSNASIQQTIRDIIGGVIALMSAVGIVALAVAFWLSSRMTRPLARLTDAAKAVGRGNFAQRVEVDSGDELEVLAQAFNHMSEDIQRTQAERELRARQQAALAELGQSALAGTDLPTLMERTVELTSHFLNVEYTKVLELLPDGNTLRLVAGVGWKDGTIGHATIDVSENSQVGQTLIAIEPLLIEDATTETRFDLPPLLKEHGVMSGLSVAINSGLQVYGILGAHTARRRPFTTDETHFLQAIANVLAAAFERTHAETALKESEERYRQLIELSPEMIVVHDDQKVLYTNPAGAELIKNPQFGQLIGRPGLDVTPAIRATQERPAPSGFGDNDKRIAEGQLLWTGGDLMHFEITSAPITYLGHPARQAIVRDVTERKRAEARLHYYTTRLESLHEIDRAILSARSPNEIASAALIQLRTLVPCASASVTLFDFDADRARVLAVNTDHPTSLSAGDEVPLADFQGLAEMREGHISFDPGARSNGYALPAGLLPGEVASVISTPLAIQDTLIGSINLGLEADNTIQDEHLEIVQEVANQLAVAIYQARLHEQVQTYNVQLEKRVAERTAELVVANKLLKREIREHRRTEEAEREQRTLAEALRDTAAALNRTLDLDSVLERVLTHLERVIPHDVANIMLVESGVARIAGTHGYTEHNVDPTVLVQPYPIDDYPNLHRMALTRQPVAIADTLATGEDEWSTPPELAWLRSYAGAPVHWNEAIIGFINVESATPGFYTAAHAERLGVFADQAAIAIRNAQLFTQAQELATLQERQRLAHELHDAVSQTLWSASLIADVLPTMWESNPDKGREKLVRLKQLTRGALAEMRTLLLELRPTALVEVGMDDLLRQLAAAIASRTRAEIDLTADECALPPDLQMVFYRIAQESLNNIARHAMATHIDLRLACTPDRVEMSIVDNGQGFDPAEIPAGHFGVGIMKERAAAVGAACTVTSAVGQGTQVHLTWTRDGRNGE